MVIARASDEVPSQDASPLQVVEVSERAHDAQGWLVVDSLAGGVSLGGLRVGRDVSRDQVAAMARCATWKLAVHGLPVGGAQAGLRADPADPRNSERLRVFAEQCRDQLESSTLLGSGDADADPLVDGLYDAIGLGQMHVARRRAPHGAVPERLRDLRGCRPHMTGLGVSWAAQEALGGSLRGVRVAIQGFGGVGAGSAARMGAMGARIVAVSDRHGAVIRPEGLSVESLLVAQESDGTLSRRRLPVGAEITPRVALFDVEADVLVLAASPHSVDEAVIRRVRAPVVVEAAGFALTPEARAVAQGRGLLVIPDVIAGSGSVGMIGRQLATGNSLPAGELWWQIRGSIERATRESIDRARRERVDVRSALVRSVSGGVAPRARRS
ncbi:MAG: Glu/Leu/Phe/Val dehydrogenase dimerization domain-containing protein [Myxococcota bacterium]